MNKPLAQRLKPVTLDDIIGQSHLIGENKILTNLVKSKKLFSLILFGKPGIGKTSIAHALVNDLDMRYRFLNAVSNTKKDLDIVIEEAKMYGSIILIMDEIHRLNKDKQDILLPVIESGLIILIGLTSSNPYHSINPAIRSRCHLFELYELTNQDIIKGLKKASLLEEFKDKTITDEAVSLIAKVSGNDLRYAYNLLEIAFITDEKVIDIDVIKLINSKAVFYSDKSDEYHYDVLSGLQKSIRGSDVNASIHYVARLITQGDLESIFRRLSVIAYEDIGLANIDMGPRLDAAINAALRVGMPEARIIISQIVIEMALSPKSNTAYLAIASALEDIKDENTSTIPKQIKTNSPTYIYPHDYPNVMVKQTYLPNSIKNRKYYIPKELGYEKHLKEVYDKIEKFKESK